MASHSTTQITISNESSWRKKYFWKKNRELALSSVKQQRLKAIISRGFACLHNHIHSNLSAGCTRGGSGKRQTHRAAQVNSIYLKVSVDFQNKESLWRGNVPATRV